MQALSIGAFEIVQRILIFAFLAGANFLAQNPRAASIPAFQAATAVRIINAYLVLVQTNCDSSGLGQRVFDFAHRQFDSRSNIVNR